MEDLPTEEEGYFICCSNGDLDSFEGNDYYMLTQSRYYVIVIKGDALMQELAPKVEQELVNLNVLQ